jgi:hypothetical protein
MEHNADWKIKFAFIGWCAVSVGMIYDTVMGFIKAFRSTENASPRRR